MHFLLFSYGNFQSFLKSFPNNCVLRPNVPKINEGFVNLFEKKLKLCIYCNFLKKFFCKFGKIFRKMLRPPESLPGRSPKMFPPNRNPGGATACCALFSIKFEGEKFFHTDRNNYQQIYSIYYIDAFKDLMQSRNHST